MIFAVAYADTANANFGWIKNIPGAIIRTSNNKLWLRNNVATTWIEIGSGGGGGGGTWGSITGTLSDQTDLQTALDLKLNISDTALMLSNYLNNVGYGLLRTGQTARLDSATVFPQIRATVPTPTNTDSLFGILDNSFALDRYVNGHGSYGFEWDSLSYFFLSGKSGNSIQTELMGSSPYFQYSVGTGANGVSSTSQGTSSNASWIVGSTTSNGNQYFSADASSTSKVGQIGSSHNVSGRWIDSRYETRISSTTVSESQIEQWLEQWTGSATQRFTNVRYLMDSMGFAIQTYRRAGAYDPTRAAYKGLRVDTSSNIRFENYPSTRNDGGFPVKVLYSSNSSGDISFGYLDTTFYQTKAATKKTTDSVVALIGAGSGTVTNVASGYGLSGGPITTTGTLLVDTLNISTRGWRQKGLDSLATLISGGGWSLSGNSLTAGSETGSFIGSTNNVSMRFRTNNNGRVTIDSNGTVLFNKASAYTSGGDGLIIHGYNSSAFNYGLMVEDASNNGIFYVQNNSTINFGGFTSSVWGANSSIDITNATVSATNISFASYIQMNEIATPSTPGANKSRIYPKSDGLWYGIDDAGTETLLSNAGGSGITIGTTTITSGTSTRVLYNNAGVVGEYAIGSGISTWWATPSSANLRSAVTDENGTGDLLFSSNTSATFTTPVINGTATGTGVATAATASTLVLRDADANITANNWLGGYATTATAAGTTTLTVGSAYLQYFTGSTTQTVTLPVASTLTLGHQFIIVNNSTGNVTVNSSGGNAVVVLAGSTSTVVTCILTSGTTAASWSQSYAGVNVASGKKATQNNSITYSGTDGTTMTFPTTSATIARTDAAQTFTGSQSFASEIVTNTAVTASGNAATVAVTASLTTVTNNSAATLTITMATASAVDGQISTVRILDATAATQTITWVNTENSSITAPTTSNGSTTLFLTVKFIYNSATSKWRCIGFA